MQWRCLDEQKVPTYSSTSDGFFWRWWLGVVLVMVVVLFLFVPTSASAFISGTVYTNLGTTTAPSGISLRVVVSTTTDSVYTVTTTAGGAWSLTGVATSSVASTTPIIVFIDASSTDATTLVSGFTGSAVTGVPLYYNNAVIRGVVSTSTVEVERFTRYDRDDDADVLFMTATSGTSTTFFSDVNVNQGVFTFPRWITQMQGNLVNNATMVRGTGVLELTGSSKVLSGNLTGTSSLGALVVFGSYTVATTVASTSDLLIESSGSFIAPTVRLTVAGSFENLGTFNDNGGEFDSVGVSVSPAQSFATVNGRNAGGSTAAAVVDMSVSVLYNNRLYVGKAGNATACSQTAGSAIGCELIIFDVSSTTNPVYVGGRDITGSATGTGNLAIRALAVSGDFLYVGSAASSTACSQAVGSAGGCELKVFDIASATNPIYVAGRDSAGDAASTTAVGISSLVAYNGFLYAGYDGSATACSQTIGGAHGCELKVYSLASSTNPTMVGSVDVSGGAAGTEAVSIRKLIASGPHLYVGKASSTAACSQTSGTAGAAACEIAVFDISSTTNPAYVRGVDSSGNTTGQGAAAVNDMVIKGTYLYVAKQASTTATCSQTAGSATGCELMVFGIASATNPVFLTGIESSGTTSNSSSESLTTLEVDGNNYLYVGKIRNFSTTCVQDPATGGGGSQGCEFMVFDISSSSLPTFLFGREFTYAEGLETIAHTGVVYVFHRTSGFSCTAPSYGDCGLNVFTFTPRTRIEGALTGTSELGNISVSGVVAMLNNASTTNVVVRAASTSTFPVLMSVTGNYTNNGVAIYEGSAETIFTSASAQSISGNLGEVSGFKRVRFLGAGTKTISAPASTTDFTIPSGVTVVAPSGYLTVGGTFSNSGTFTATSTILNLRSYFGTFVAGRGGGAGVSESVVGRVYDMEIVGQHLYVARGPDTTNCTQTIGSTRGCELHIYDISSTTNPTFVRGIDSTAAQTGTGDGGWRDIAVRGTYLYVAREALFAGNCNPVAGSAAGCSLQIYDISSTTNPVFVTGRDDVGTASSTSGNNYFDQLMFDGDVLYTAKLGSSATACSSTPGQAAGCEVMVFDVSSTTNPVYVGGADSSGTSAGTSTTLVNDIQVVGDYLYLTRAGVSDVCTQTVGQTAGCELIILDISSSTNPVFYGGRDSSGSATQGLGFSANGDMVLNGSVLYMDLNANSATPCTTVSGSCELHVYDVSSPTNPVIVNRIDADGSRDGVGSLGYANLLMVGEVLYALKEAPGTGQFMTCGNRPGFADGCAALAFDVSSSTNPELLDAVDASFYRAFEGADTGSLGMIVATGSQLYVGRVSTVVQACNGSSTLSSPSTIAGCVLTVFSPATATGTLTGSSRAASLVLGGQTRLGANASTTNLANSGTTQLPNILSVSGDISNNGTVNPGLGRVILSGSNQSITGLGTTTFYILTRLATTTSSLTVSAGGSIVVGSTTTLVGSSGNRFSLQSSAPGSVWYFLPQGGVTAQHLDVQDSYNLGASITCTTGCVDGGNNTNWTFVVSDVLAGTLYTTLGGANGPSGQVIGIAIGTSSPSVYQVTTEPNGRWSLSLAATSSISSSTPFLVWLDGVATDATTLVMGYGGSAVTGVPVYYNTVATRGVASTSVVDVTRFDFYDRDNDADLLIQTATSATSTVLLQDLVHTQGVLQAPRGGLELLGSFTNNATFDDNFGTLRLAGTGESVAGTVTGTSELGSVYVTGSYTFPALASTSDLAIAQGGSLVAPATRLTVEGKFANDGNFDDNGGELAVTGLTSDLLRYVVGRDAHGSTNGTSNIALNTVIASGSIAYIGKAGSNLACNSVAASAGSCEIAVFDISSTTNPTFLAARDSDGLNGGTTTLGINALVVKDTILYVGKTGSSTVCSQTAGYFAAGCELMMFNVASATNPTYVAGLDAGGTTASSSAVSINAMARSGNYLYVVKANSVLVCSQTAGLADGCELMVFDISSSTNPIYVAGRDVNGSPTGNGNIAGTAIAIDGNYLYLTSGNSNGTCSDTAGSAIGCELKVFDIASATNPVYVAGRDASGSSGGTGNVAARAVAVADGHLYFSKDGNGTACVATAGSATGCELLVFNVASATNPVLVAARDASGNATGSENVRIDSLLVKGATLFVGKLGSSTICTQVAGAAQGCELQVYDVSSSSNPIFIAGQDANGNAASSSAVSINDIFLVGNNHLYTTKSNGNTACSQTAGTLGAQSCELMVFDVSLGGQVVGALTGSSDLGNVVLNNRTRFLSRAAVNQFTNASSSTTTAPDILTIAGDFINRGTYLANGGEVVLTGANQTLITSGTTTFYSLTKTASASTTLTFTAGSAYVASGTVTMQGTLAFPLKLRSTASGTPWILSPQATITVAYVNVKDSFNAASTSISCGIGCIDAGNNTNWFFFFDPAGSLVSGTLYLNQGITAAGASNTIAILIATSTPSLYIATTTASGTWGAPFIGDLSQVTSQTPIVVWLDASSTDATVLTVPGDALTASSVPLYANTVVTYASAPSTNIPLGQFGAYDRSDDADILYLTSATATTFFANWVHERGQLQAPALPLVLTGSFTNNDTFIQQSGDLVLAGSGTLSGTLAGTSSLGSVQVLGTYTMASAASTSALLIEAGGALTAPASVLSIRQGDFVNRGSFTNSGGTVVAIGASTTDRVRYTVGFDSLGTSATGTDATQVNVLVVRSGKVYAGYNSNAGCFSQSQGGTPICFDVKIFDVASTGNPIYISGINAGGGPTSTAGGVNVQALAVSGNYLYVGRSYSSTACSQTPGSAVGCELIVLDISSSTNPIYVAGRDMSGNATGTAGSFAQGINALTIQGNYLYVGQSATAGTCSQAIGSAQSCELQVYDISSSTNPIYVAGRDSDGAAAGTLGPAITSLQASGTILYVGKAVDSTVCNQAVGSGDGCEVMVFNIASATNPIYVAGRDSDGAAAGTLGPAVTDVVVQQNRLYVAKGSDSTACNVVAGGADGCEIIVFDISSSTNPILTGGRDSSGTVTGAEALNVNELSFDKAGLLYAVKAGSATACSAPGTSGCELMVFDMASATSPTYIAGLDGNGLVGGTSTVLVESVAVGDGFILLGKAADSTLCTTTNATGCELVVAETVSKIAGSFVGSSAFGDVLINRSVDMLANASATDVTVTADATLLAPALLSLTGNYTNNGSVIFDDEAAQLILNGSAQTLGGTLAGTSSLPTMVFAGSGTKTFLNDAAVAGLVIRSGVTVSAPTSLSAEGDVVNNGIYDNGSLLELGSSASQYITGIDSGAGASATGTYRTLIQGTIAYVVKQGDSGTCSSTVRTGCELMVFDISSGTNPVYVGGQEGAAAGDTNTASILNLRLSNNLLYVTKAGNSGTCSSTVRTGCELMVFDISSSTNPVYVNGQDSTTGTGADLFYNLAISSTTLYVTKAGNSGTCSSTVRTGCELMVFDISSTTNPVYVNGQDSTTGAGTDVFYTPLITGTTLYIGKLGNSGTCSSTVRTGCELMVFDISSSTNPVYVNGQDSTTGAGTSGASVNSMVISGTSLYFGKIGNSGTCSSSDRTGCELMVFDISSSTNPVYVNGQDSTTGTGADIVYGITTSGSLLYLGKQGNSGTCSSSDRTGCELMVFDISSTTNPVYVGGQQGAGTSDTTSATLLSPTVSGGFLYANKVGNSGTCSSTDRTGCELMVFDIASDLSGTLTGTSALGNVSVSGNARFQDNASTTNLTVIGALVAPTHLSIEGNYTQSGDFSSYSGTVYLSGTTQQTATGTMTGTNAFHNLQIKNTTGNGTTSQAIVFGAPVQTTGTFTMNASSSARFLANATNTFEAVNWTGTTNSPVWLRSSATGTQWRFQTDDFVSTSYVNVRDSFNGSVSTVSCTTGCTDVGNNTNWSFTSSTPTTGSLTLTEHPADQADNLFSFQNQTDGIFYRFSMTAATETAIVDDVVLSVFGLRGVDTSEVTDLRLYRDNNNDGLLDGGDTQVLGAGIFAISGETGTITFSSGTTSVATTSAQRYIVTADTVAIDNNDWMNVQLRSTGVTATGLTSGLSTTMSGSLSSLQHIRSNAGGSGANRAPIGGDAPAGVVQSGGGSGGGGNNAEVGQLPEGANITPDPDFFRPTNTGSPHNEWTGGANAYASDGTYATAASANLRQTYGGFGFNIPGSNTIQGIQVKLDGSGTTAAGTIQVALSWDGGTTITTLEATPTLSGSDVVYTLGGQTNLWGRTWTATELNDTNFRLRVVAQPSSNTVRLDAIEVRVYHTAGGGGQGGGAGGGAI